MNFHNLDGLLCQLGRHQPSVRPLAETAHVSWVSCSGRDAVCGTSRISIRRSATYNCLKTGIATYHCLKAAMQAKTSTFQRTLLDKLVLRLRRCDALAVPATPSCGMLSLCVCVRARVHGCMPLSLCVCAACARACAPMCVRLCLCPYFCLYDSFCVCSSVSCYGLSLKIN